MRSERSVLALGAVHVFYMLLLLQANHWCHVSDTSTQCLLSSIADCHDSNTVIYREHVLNYNSIRHNCNSFGPEQLPFGMIMKTLNHWLVQREFVLIYFSITYDFRFVTTKSSQEWIFSFVRNEKIFTQFERHRCVPENCFDNSCFKYRSLSTAPQENDNEQVTMQDNQKHLQIVGKMIFRHLVSQFWKGKNI